MQETQTEHREDASYLCPRLGHHSPGFNHKMNQRYKNAAVIRMHVENQEKGSWI